MFVPQYNNGTATQDAWASFWYSPGVEPALFTQTNVQVNNIPYYRQNFQNQQDQWEIVREQFDPDGGAMLMYTDFLAYKRYNMFDITRLADRLPSPTEPINLMFMGNRVDNLPYTLRPYFFTEKLNQITIRFSSADLAIGKAYKHMITISCSILMQFVCFFFSCGEPRLIVLLSLDCLRRSWWRSRYRCSVYGCYIVSLPLLLYHIVLLQLCAHYDLLYIPTYRMILRLQYNEMTLFVLHCFVFLQLDFSCFVTEMLLLSLLHDYQLDYHLYDPHLSYLRLC